MPFPDLVLRPDSLLWCEATGIPDAGNNTFMLPYIDEGMPADKIEEDWLVGYNLVDPMLPGVQSAEFISLSADKRFLTIDFNTDGLGTTRFVVQLVHTEIR